MMLDEQVQTFQQIVASSTGGANGAAAISVGDVKQLMERVAQLTDAYNEQSEEVNNLKADLKFFQRREPLVHVLWGEIARLREQIADAISQGYAYVSYETIGQSSHFECGFCMSARFWLCLCLLSLSKSKPYYHASFFFSYLPSVLFTI